MVGEQIERLMKELNLLNVENKLLKLELPEVKVAEIENKAEDLTRGRLN